MGMDGRTSSRMNLKNVNKGSNIVDYYDNIPPEVKRFILDDEDDDKDDLIMMMMI